MSLLPSATEILAAVGVREDLVGVTHECDWPEWVAGLPRLTRSLIAAGAASAEIDRQVRSSLASPGALYALDDALLARLRPDLIVTQSLCGVCAVAEADVARAACGLAVAPRVVNLEPRTLGEVLAAIGEVASACGRAAAGVAARAALQRRVAAVARRVAGRPRPRVALLEWLDPPFSCGHWNPELVTLAGGEEVLGRPGEASRARSWDEVAAAQPEVVVVSCCGYRAERALEDVVALNAVPEWRRLPAVGSGAVFVVDGTAYFSRPGPRLVDSLEILAACLHGAGSAYSATSLMTAPRISSGATSSA